MEEFKHKELGLDDLKNSHPLQMLNDFKIKKQFLNKDQNWGTASEIYFKNESRV